MSVQRRQQVANDTTDFWIQYLIDDHICSTLHQMLRLDCGSSDAEEIDNAKGVLDVELEYAEKLVDTIKGLLADLDKDPSAFLREHRH